MRWITALVEFTETTARATAELTPDHFALANGALMETALVECVAQTVAAAQGAKASAAGGARPSGSGMLVAVSGFRIESRPAVGKIICVDVRELRRFGPMLLVAGTITCDGTSVASGELTLYA